MVRGGGAGGVGVGRRGRRQLLGLWRLQLNCLRLLRLLHWYRGWVGLCYDHALVQGNLLVSPSNDNLLRLAIGSSACHYQLFCHLLWLL